MGSFNNPSSSSELYLQIQQAGILYITEENLEFISGHVRMRALNLVDRHIFTEDHEMHRDSVLEQVDKTISAGLVKLNTEYKQDIRNYAQSKIEQDNANRLKAAKAAEKREKDKLPFVR
jgi:rubrerythrin